MALVLSRKMNESIVINDNIEVMVVEVRGDKVRLAFVAPREVSIHRREIYDSIARDKAAAKEETASEDQPPNTNPVIPKGNAA